MAPSKSASREVAKLTCSHLTDGRRGLDRGRDPSRDPLLSERIVQLFHSGPVAARVHGGRRLVPLHSSPNIFLVERFLSPCELEHLDSLITARRAAFKQSFTDDAAGKDTLSWERTSLTLMLPKSVNAAVRAIEARATDLVGLPPDHIEPLQVVSYAEGARFDLHHDLGVLHLAGDDAEEEVLSVEPAGDPVSSGAPSPQADPHPSDRHRPVDGRERELQEQPAGAAAHGAGPRVPGHPAPDARDEYEGMSVEVGGGPRRVVTIFVYLNTLPNGVGHTEFPQLGLSVRPKCGSALLFCNVLRDGKPDPRTAHRAAPVTAPHRKLGCNLWLTDVTMQAHAVSTPSSARARAGGSKPPKRPGGGVLSSLLASEVHSLNVPPPAALVGLSFVKNFVGYGQFVGAVSSYHPQYGFRLLYTDGDEEDLSLDALCKLQLEQPDSLVGRPVTKHFPGHGRFEGCVEGFDAEDKYFKVQYDDGDSEHLLHGQIIRILLPPRQPKKRRR